MPRPRYSLFALLSVVTLLSIGFAVVRDIYRRPLEVAEYVEPMDGWVEFAEDDFLGYRKLIGIDLDVSAATDEDFALIEPLSSIRTLSLRGTTITDASAVHLGKFTGLVELKLSELDESSETLQQLAMLPNLRSVNLDFSSIGDAEIRQIALNSNVNELSAYGTFVTADAVGKIKADRPNLAISWSTISSEEVRQACVRLLREGAGTALFEQSFQNPRRASIHFFADEWRASPKSYDFLKTILNSELAEIGIRGGEFTDYSFLAEGPSIEIFLLIGVSIDDDEFSSLRNVKRLRDLFLKDLSISDEAFTGLASIHTLETIRIYDCGVTDDCIKHLSELPRLRYLDLQGTTFTEEVLNEVARIESLQGLTLRCPQISAAAVADFQKKRPDVDLYQRPRR